MKPLTSWDLGNYWAALRHYPGRVLLVLLAAAIAGGAWITWAPRRYVSEGKLLVRLGRENATLDPTVAKGEAIAVNVSREEEMNTMVQHLRSRQVAEKVLDLCRPLPPDTDAEARERALMRLQKEMSVTSPRTSNVVNLQVKAEDPALAQKLAASWVEVYLEDHMRVARPSTAYEFLRAQATKVAADLAAAEEALRDAKNRAGLASIEGRRTALESQINAVETQLHQVRAQHQATEAKSQALRQRVAALPEPLLRQMVGGAPNDGMAAMRDRLFQLEVRKEEVLAKYAPPHPVATAINQQVEEVTETLKRGEPQQTQVVAALSAADEANLAGLNAQKQSLEKQHGDLLASLNGVNQDEVTLAAATRKIRELETKYHSYARSVEEARIDQELRQGKISNVIVLQPPAFMPLSVEPRKGLVAAIAALAGFLGAIGIATLSELRAASRAAGPSQVRLADEPAHVHSLLEKPRTAARSVVTLPR